jgi:hypothetical protein
LAAYLLLSPGYHVKKTEVLQILNGTKALRHKNMASILMDRGFFELFRYFVKICVMSVEFYAPRTPLLFKVLCAIHAYIGYGALSYSLIFKSIIISKLSSLKNEINDSDTDKEPVVNWTLKQIILTGSIITRNKMAFFWQRLGSA